MAGWLLATRRPHPKMACPLFDLISLVLLEALGCPTNHSMAPIWVCLSVFYWFSLIFGHGPKKLTF